MTGRRTGAILVAILLLAAAARLLVQRDVRADPDTFFPIIDAEAYLLQALRVADGRDVVDGIYFQAPGYPLLLGSLLRAGGLDGHGEARTLRDVPDGVRERALVLGRGLNVALGLLTVLVVFLLGRALDGAATGLVAAALAALYAPFVFYEAHLLKVSLSLLPLPLAVLGAVRAARRDRPGAFVWCGLALGLGGWVRGNLYLVAWAGALLLLVGAPRGWGPRARARAAAALVLGLLVALAPLVARNSRVAGHLVLTTAAGGTAFYLCNDPHNETGLVEHVAFNRQVPHHEENDWKAQAQEETGRRLEGGELSRYWMGRALDAIGAQPGRWLLAEARKAGLFLSRYEAPDNTQLLFAEPSSAFLRLSPVRYGLVLPLALGGWVAWTRLRRRAAAGPALAARAAGGGAIGDAPVGDGGLRDDAFGRRALLAALLLYAGSLLLFVMTSRFRMPAVPLVLVLAGALVVRLPALATRAHGRDRVWVGGAVLLGWALSLASEGPLGPLTDKELASHLAVRHINRARVRLDRGDWELARADYVAALRRHAGALTAWVELARVERLQALETVARAAATEDASARAALLEDAASRRVFARTILRDKVFVHRPEHAEGWRELGFVEYDVGNARAAADAFGRTLEVWPGDRLVHTYRALALLAASDPASAETDARWLVEQDASADDGHGILALALVAQGRADEARAAVAAYDRAAAARRAAGLVPFLDDQPAFEPLR